MTNTHLCSPHAKCLFALCHYFTLTCHCFFSSCSSHEARALTGHNRQLWASGATHTPVYPFRVAGTYQLA